MKKRKICVVTGSRAEYGLLRGLMERIRDDVALVLQVVVTGSHLSDIFGQTWRVIQQDGFLISCKIPILSRENSATGVTKSLGKAVLGFAGAYKKLSPDLIVLVGDRYEILAAVSAALIAKIPVAHLAGGDVTEGAYDDSIRHAITKMSHLHFVTNAVSAARVRQMGEDPRKIWNVGHTGIDEIRQLKPLTRAELETVLGFRFLKRNVLVTFHPVTLDDLPSDRQFGELLSALHKLEPEIGIIFTKPNADTDGLKLIRMIEGFVRTHKNAKVYASLGQKLYLNTVHHVDAVVGNSSSGIYEVPCFHKPTVNIGDRQKGRIHPASVINCKPCAPAILKAIRKALKTDCSRVKNPYGDGRAASRIFRIIKAVKTPGKLLKKLFLGIGLS